MIPQIYYVGSKTAYEQTGRIQNVVCNTSANSSPFLIDAKLTKEDYTLNIGFGNASYGNFYCKKSNNTYIWYSEAKQAAYQMNSDNYLYLWYAFG